MKDEHEKIAIEVAKKVDNEIEKEESKTPECNIKNFFGIDRLEPGNVHPCESKSDKV